MRSLNYHIHMQQEGKNNPDEHSHIKANVIHKGFLSRATESSHGGWKGSGWVECAELSIMGH